MNTDHTHGGFAGKSLIEKIEDKLDKAYQDAHAHWPNANELEREAMERSRYWGRVEGVAAALGILRGSTTSEEIDRAEERVT